MKIIWNITKKCYYNCSICGTNSDIDELLLNEKKVVLNKLLASNFNIREIDFSGGDPLCCSDSLKIIDSAIDRIGMNKVSITTTSKGINGLSLSRRKKYLYKCELTLDLINQSQKKYRNTLSYSSDNYKSILENKMQIKNLSINIPIINTDLNKNQIIDVVKMINNIPHNNKTVNLLRLMPVGNYRYDDYPDNYSPTKIKRLFEKHLSNDIELHLHCALRGLAGNKENCTMGIKKIGIDCGGNVFACAWAGYLPVNLNDNPFYIGNLLINTINEIMKNEKYLYIKNHIYKNNGSCCIFSFLNSGDIFSNNDTLIIQ